MKLPDDVHNAFKRVTERAVAFNPAIVVLRERLLREGGQEVLFNHPEPDIVELIEQGRVFDHRIQGYPGRAGACHQNVADFWQREPQRFRIATGYGLNPFGTWLQHWWLVNAELGIHETTGIVFEKYFGIVYTREQARRFVREIPRDTPPMRF